METGGRVRRTCLDSTGFRDSKQIGVHKCCNKVTNPVKEVSKDDFELRVDCFFFDGEDGIAHLVFANRTDRSPKRVQYRRISIRLVLQDDVTQCAFVRIFQKNHVSATLRR